MNKKALLVFIVFVLTGLSVLDSSVKAQSCSGSGSWTFSSCTWATNQYVCVNTTQSADCAWDGTECIRAFNGCAGCNITNNGQNCSPECVGGQTTNGCSGGGGTCQYNSWGACSGGVERCTTNTMAQCGGGGCGCYSNQCGDGATRSCGAPTSAPTPSCYIVLPNGQPSYTMNVGQSALLGVGVGGGYLMDIYSTTNGGSSWTQWLDNNPSSNGAITFGCSTPGLHTIVCNVVNTSNAILCSGNPFGGGYPRCGGSDSRTINCISAPVPTTPPPPPTAVPPPTGVPAIQPTCSLGFDASRTSITTGTTLNFSVTSGNGGNQGYIVHQSTSGGTGTLLFPGSAPNGSASYTFNSPGSYYISCNSINSNQSSNYYCQGSPASAGPNCGSNDYTTITVNAVAVPTSPPVPTSVPPTPVPTSVPPTAPPAGCSVTTSPSQLNLTTGGTGIFAVTINSSGVVSNISYGVYDTAVAQILGTSGNTVTVRGRSAGFTAAWVSVQLTNGNTCSTPAGNDTDVNVSSVVVPTSPPAPTSPPVPTSVPPTPVPTSVPPTPVPGGCSVSTAPSQLNLLVNNSGSITATAVVSGGASVTSYTFGSYDNGVARVHSSSGRTATIRGEGAGFTAIWTHVELNNGNSCDTPAGNDTDVSVGSVVVPTSPPAPTSIPFPTFIPLPTAIPPTPIPPTPTPIPPTPTPVPCALSVNIVPGSTSVEIGETTNLSVIVTPITSTCNNITTAVTVSPSGIVSTSGNITVNAIGVGTATVTVNVYNNGQLRGTDTSTVTVICTPPTPPSNLSAVDAIFKIDLTWSDNDPVNTGYELVRDSIPATTPFPLPGSASSYRDGPAAGLCATAHYYELRAVNSAKPACQYSPFISTIGRCEDYKAWFGSEGGGVIAGETQMQSQLPSWAPGPFDVYADVYLINDPASGDAPGMAIAPSFDGFDQDQANSKSWQVPGYSDMSAILAKSENSYSSMLERVLAKVTPVGVGTGVLSTANFGGYIGGAGAGSKTAGVTVLRSGSLQISGLDVGANKALLFVDGNVTISNTISLGSGFLAIIASGNITVAPTVGDSGTTHDTFSGNTLNIEPGIDIRSAGYTPHLEGIFLAGGVFSTGAIDSSLTPARHRLLRVDGSVIGMSGVQLSRDVRSPLPAEYVVFRPDLTYQLSQVGLRRKTYQELLGP